jgi:hypothetical protein
MALLRVSTMADHFLSGVLPCASGLRLPTQDESPRDQMAVAELARTQALGADSDMAGTFHSSNLTGRKSRPLLVFSSDPPSLPAILEVLARLLRNPVGASDVLRHLWASYLWCAQLGNTSFPELTPGYSNTASIVLAKDLTTTFAKATGISEALYSSLKPL